MRFEQSDATWDALQHGLGASFLQSGGWAAFQAALGVPTYRFEGEGWSALCLEHKTKAGTYWFVPYGPTTTGDHALKAALATLKSEAKKNGVSWLRIEPPEPIAHLTKLEPLAVRTAQKLNPEFTIVSDLREDEAGMRARLTPNKRNLVNRGTKRGLQFEISTDPKDMATFTDMLHVTEARTGARSHGDSYYMDQAATLMPLGMLTLPIARGLAGQPLACIVMLTYGNTTSRVYAASYPEARKFEAGVGLDWHTMLSAKDQGLEWFDFYGAAPPDAGPEHPMSGFTKYKAEFGGEYVAHGGSWDVPLNNTRYKLYLSLRRLKKLTR